MAITWVVRGPEEELAALAAQAPVHTHTQTQMETGMTMRRTKIVTVQSVFISLLKFPSYLQ